MDTVGFAFAVIALPEKDLKRFTCFLCRLIFRDPVQSRLCDHRFCQKCHEKYLRENQKRVCPQCKEEDPENAEDLERGQVFVDRAFKRECDRLPAKCLERGCAWTGQLGSYEEHERVCEFKAVKCDTCGKTVVANNMDKHKTDECPKAMVNCRKCNKAMLKRTIQDHEKKCNGLVVEDRCGSNATRLSQVGDAVNLRKENANEPEVQSENGSGHGSNDAAPMQSLSHLFDRIVEVRRRSDENRTILDRSEKKLKSVEKKNEEQNEEQAPLPGRIEMLENAFYDGVLMWKLNEFTRRRQEALMQKTNSIYSSPFFTSRTGYKLCARIYLNGDGMGKNSHISLFIVVMKGPYDALLRWPFQQKVTLTIIDQAGKDHVVDTFQPDTLSSSFKRPTSDMNIASGCPLFMPLSYLDMKDRNYMKDDCMFVKVVVDTRDLNA